MLSLCLQERRKRGVVNVLGAWLKFLRARFARGRPSTSLLQILDTPLESMSICLQNIIKDVEFISKEGIEVDEIFEVDFYLGADWKFLATVCGIESPNCTHACIWCTCPKKERYNGEKEWSLSYQLNQRRNLIVHEFRSFQ